MSGSGEADSGVRCLVVGYDRTESARGAVAWAASEVSGDGKLVLVHSCRGLHAPPSPLSSSRERRELGRALIDELMLEGEDSLFDLDVEAEITDEDPVTALIDAATRHHARLIVVGCEQHSPLRKAFGTVTSVLVSRSPVPVTAVGPQAAPRDAVLATRTRGTRADNPVSSFSLTCRPDPFGSSVRTGHALARASVKCCRGVRRTT